MPGNAAIYAPTPELPSPATLRALTSGAKVFSSAESRSGKNPRFVIEWPGLKVAINQMPADKLAHNLLGFQGYLEQQCEVHDPTLIGRIAGMKQCLGVIVEPDFDDEGRVQQLVLALAAQLEGICFVGDSVYAPDGGCLASPPEEEDAQDEDDEEEDEEDAQDASSGESAPPTASRVARRALVLGAIAARVALEGDPGADREERRQWLLGRMGELELEEELEPQERRQLETPADQLPRKQAIEGSWRSEGMVVLAWALGLCELPAPDRLAKTWDLLIQDLKLLTVETPPVLTAPTLRSPEELKRMERRLFILHWRLREFSLRPKAMNFPEFARTAWFGPFDPAGIPLAGDDLAIDGVPLAQAPKERIWEAQSIALERHQAINWLLGKHRRYSRVDTPT